MNCYKQLFLITAATVCVGSSLSMDTGVLGIQVKTSDNKEFTLPQWKIEESRLLHTKQQWQLFKEKYDRVPVAPIQLKTICSQKLELFSQALEAQDFSEHFNGLTHDKKRLLLCAAGEQELDSPVLTQKLVKTYLGLELCECISTHVPIAEVVNHLRYLVIHDNCQHKSFAQERSDYLENNNCCVARGDNYASVPKILGDQINFSGATLPIGLDLCEGSNNKWIIDNFAVKAKQALYFFTSIDPSDKENPWGKKSNKKKVWVKLLNQEKKCFERILEHVNEIELHAFSKGGNYFATTSNGLRDSQLMLTNLAIQNDKFVGSDVWLTGFDGIIDWINFGNRSNVLAALSGKKIYFWDAQTNSLVSEFDCPVAGEIQYIKFNDNDTRLAIACFDEAAEASTVVLLDITDITKIIHIRSLVLKDLSTYIVEFTRFGNELIVGTNHSVLLLDPSGDIIMDTGAIKEKSNTSRDWVRAVCMKNIPFLATLTHDSNNECNVALWDSDLGKCLATLSEKEKSLVGIGITSNCRSVISIGASFDMIKTDLYDDSVAGCLKWIPDEINLFQKYLLLRLYRASKLNDLVDLHPDSSGYRILQSFPIAPSNVKGLVEKYLLKK